MGTSRTTIENLLSPADVKVTGERPWDIKVNDERIFSRILSEGALGLGESYMDKDWDCEALDVMLYKVLTADLESKVQPLKMIFPIIKAWLINRQRKSKAFQIGRHHYDIGNDLYTHMLDSRMTYTCGYWKNASNLENAQLAKLDLICKKIKLVPGMKILDIGCGWGSFMGYAAEKYGIEGVGITVSKEQIDYAKKRYKNLPIEFRFQDYREIDEPFDRIVSVGMFEHVGPKNYRTYMKTVNRCLKDDGWFLLHTIGTNTPKTSADPWTDKYIFPGGVLPTSIQICKSVENIFLMRDWHNFPGDYDRTLMAWCQNFHNNWKELDGYDERFYRMWRFFLLSAAGAFRANRNQLWQIVFSKSGTIADYDSVR